MNTNTSDQTVFEHHSGYIDNIGHELKTPLNAINALSGLLVLNEQQNLTSDQIDQLQIIHRSGEMLASLIDEVLTLFQLRDAGGLSLDVDELSLHSLAHALQTHFDEHVQGKDITFSFVVDPLLPVIDTDNQKLLKILRNLLDNAIRFTHSGSINVAFMAGEYPEFPVSCHIADTGCGIPVEKFPLIFSAFRQLNETATRQHEGLGLGLTIAKSYTHLLGGEITLSSEVGKGTEFIVKLPESPFVSKKSVIDHKVNQEEPTPLVTGMIETTAHHLPEAGSERAILLVDDDYRNQYAMKAMIEETKGNKVLIAQDGVQAMQLLKDHPEIQLVITDIAMPEMDGYDLINKIRENRVLAYLPIIAVTAMPESDEDKILSSGANAYLRKPITMDKFFHLLKHCKDANSICS